MRRIVFLGFAMMASLLVLNPALGQQSQPGSWDQSSSGYNMIKARAGYPLGGANGQAQARPASRGQAPVNGQSWPNSQGSFQQVNSQQGGFQQGGFPQGNFQLGTSPQANPQQGNVQQGNVQQRNNRNNQQANGQQWNGGPQSNSQAVQTRPLNPNGGGSVYQGATSSDCETDFCPEVACGPVWVAGVTALYFDRGYEDDFALGQSCDCAPVQQTLFNTDADFNGMAGNEFFISRRGVNNRGWELRFWGLYPGSEAATIGSPGVFVELSPRMWGMTLVDATGAGSTVANVYNFADTQRVVRDNSFYNLELNFLHNASNFCGQNWEWFAGVRWLQFNEDFSFQADGTTAGLPSRMNYDLAANNDLIGFQMGGRSEIPLHGRWSASCGFKAGVFGNSMSASQSIYDQNGTMATINSGSYAGTAYDFGSTKTDTAFLAELDLGLAYQFSNNWRSTLGYRVIGISGVALAPNQIPVAFEDVQQVNRIKSNNSLSMNGIFWGLEHSF